MQRFSVKLMHFKISPAKSAILFNQYTMVTDDLATQGALTPKLRFTGQCWLASGEATPSVGLPRDFHYVHNTLWIERID